MREQTPGEALDHLLSLARMDDLSDVEIGAACDSAMELQSLISRTASDLARSVSERMRREGVRIVLPGATAEEIREIKDILAGAADEEAADA